MSSSAVPTARRRLPATRHGLASRARLCEALPALLGLLVCLVSPLRADDAAEAAVGTDAATRAPLCVYVSSYHRGYSWSDGVERGLRETLDGRCELVQFDMDTKRRRTTSEMEEAAAEAAALIDRLDPDVVITSDDNAAKYLIVPYLLGGETPVVFCGINWTVEEYDFPAPNVTGIVEVAPIRPMILEALTIVPGAKRAAYLGALTLTELKNHDRIAAVADSFGISLDSLFVENLAQWKTAYDVAQGYDFVVVGSHSGIDGWDEAEAAAHALASARRPSLTNHDWMMPVTTIGYTKLPEEHGERAAATAVAILDGTAPADIPLVTNRKWDTWLNPDLAAVIETPVPDYLVRKAKQVRTTP